MDGNGRWARKRGLLRIEGHRAAERSIHEAVEGCGERSVGYLTLYAFSTENWKRPSAEVSFIMKLLSRFLERNVDDLDQNGVRIRATGRLDDLPEGPRRDLERAMKRTAANDGLHLILALSYGGRSEILDAVRRIASEVSRDELSPSELTMGTISSRLYLPDVPDPDLIIRTSGEMRLSNFLLWQSAYSELYFTDVLWPDFRKEHLFEALDDYAGRSRRFGSLSRDSDN
ncbi:di-trans,poly-cis-decaprenylcistransferase [Candidatus Fermentibacteria bacterium]|nr:di-trans,poly-cis-decaprenylcistransferase [Candidatus Fermentibacteria bacterium]